MVIRAVQILSLMVVLSACNAKMGTAGNPRSTVTPPPPPVIKPEPVWPDGYMTISCRLFGPQHVYELGRIGMLDSGGFEFRSKSYKWVQFHDEGWVLVEMNFKNHDDSVRPIPQPEAVHMEYYIFLRPEWRTPENFYEIRRSRHIPFKVGQGSAVRWPFTDHHLECQVDPTN